MSSNWILDGESRPKRRRTLTQKALEGDELPQNTASQPIELPETQFTTPLSPSLSPELTEQPCVLTKPADNPDISHIIEVDQPWELRLIDLQKAIVAPTVASSQAATVAIVEVAREDSREDVGDFDSHFTDDYDGIDWSKLRRYSKPKRTLTGKKSWIFNHGYRIALRRSTEDAEEAERTYLLCRWCHQNSGASAGSGIIEVSSATSSAAKHLGSNRRGHRITKHGKQLPQLPGGQSTIYDVLKKGIAVSQEVANELGNFDVQGFRLAAVMWLVENNHPIHEFESESFRKMLRFANPAAEEALWLRHDSVSRFLIRLYDHMKPIVKAELSAAVSKIHISFDGWTTKGGKRGFFCVVAHYADADGRIQGLPIALPQLTGVHSGEAIGQCVEKVLQAFSISSEKLGYFVLDNASSNDVAVEYLARLYGFTAAWHRLRCGPHTINLVGQTVMFGKDKDAYDNSPRYEREEEQFMADWRRQGPLGVFLDIVNYIGTPKQHSSFAHFQHIAYSEDPTNDDRLLLAVVKACPTRWNSYCASFERGILLQQPITPYSNHLIKKQADADAYARDRNNRLVPAPPWMRSDGLSAADWAVITEYVDILKPLKWPLSGWRGVGKSNSGSMGALAPSMRLFPHSSSL